MATERITDPFEAARMVAEKHGFSPVSKKSLLLGKFALGLKSHTKLALGHAHGAPELARAVLNEIQDDAEAAGLPGSILDEVVGLMYPPLEER